MVASTIDFKTYAYLTNGAQSAGIRINQFTFGLQNPVPGTGPFTLPGTIKISKGNRGFGLKPRYLRLVRTAGAAPNTKSFYTNLVILDPGQFDAIQPGAELIVDGVSYTVLRKVPETVT